MENYIFNESNGLWYERAGDYYIPCLTQPESEIQSIGVWGRRHLRYIREHRKVFYTNLLTSGKPNSYLAEVDNRAREMHAQLMEQLAEKEGISEQLKAQDQMAWVGAMTNIRNAAEEIINAEVIFA